MIMIQASSQKQLSSLAFVQNTFSTKSGMATKLWTFILNKTVHEACGPFI